MRSPPTSLIRRCGLVATILCSLATAHCSAGVVGSDSGGASESGAPTDGAAVSDGGDTGNDVPYRDVPTRYDTYLEDTCSDSIGPGTTDYQCDPFHPTVGCMDGQACYPYVTYPNGPCGREVYTATCVAAGTTPLDGFCAGGNAGCAPGLTCFITGSGDRCLQLCRIDGGDPQCPRGRVCETTDLPDFGACD